MHKHQHLLPIFVSLCAAFALIDEVDGEYLIGVGSYDMTARTFIVAESSQGARFAFVNLDAGMASQLVTIKVLQRLKTRLGDLYTQENLAISGTHTHAGPAGYLQCVVYSVTSLGFINQTFDAIVTAIEQSIIQAHNNLKPGSIFLNTGDVENAGINRIPSAYLFNPPEERARYTTNVDTTMTLLKLLDSASNRSIGAFSWFATHGTSMSRENRLISGDNKGAAARFLEDWFTFSNNFLSIRNTKFSTIQNISTLRNKAQKIKATGGKPCGKTTSQGFKVRKNDGSSFVGAFCQSNVGDVTPNVLGAFCTDTGKPCDFNHSSCNGNDQLCVGRGPGYPNEILSTKIIGERQFEKAVELFSSATNPLSGKIDYRHAFINFTSIEVQLNESTVVKTCPAAVGAGFAAGTTDGPGVFGFQQGDTEINEMWKRLRDLLKEPSQYQIDCQKPKPVLLSTGEMFVPYAWAPAILPIQILRLGNFVILSVPGEFTTMAGRRLREAVKETLINNGNGEFDNETHVVIAGLTNTYSQYIATFEEYKQQRYEAASTLYGPHTLSAYIQEFKKLAKAMATGEQLGGTGLSPPDLSSVQLSLLQDPLGDSPPPGKRFGDMQQDVAQPKGGSFKKGDKPSATFFSANPRYDLLIEGTFAVVEMLQGERWVPVYDDDDFCLFFKWNVTVDNGSLYGLATVEWEVPEDATSGVYRLRHFGSSKKTKDYPNEYFTGASSAFTVS
ncbi:hypothetical protein ES288_A05G193200v1 [Gossypium darwinii]|uniref:Neutral ceramidase n=1 Tax=Gossypium darwinii TaxID=34276 RepID=A0A5D2GJ21_GOSDA|nr:hypothetical protein ES288_A05G193200v1 [Gossypium darwinii]